MIISVFATIVRNMDMAGRAFEEKLDQVNAYMSACRLPFDLRYRVRNHFRIRFGQRQIFNEEKLMRDITPKLRTEVMQWNAKYLIHMSSLSALPTP